MTEQQALERGIKEKAIKEFLEKVHSAMADLEFDIGNINEDTMHDWNRLLSKVTDEILAEGKDKSSSNRENSSPPDNDQKETNNE
jgi:hypothetical protein